MAQVKFHESAPAGLFLVSMKFLGESTAMAVVITLVLSEVLRVTVVGPLTVLSFWGVTMETDGVVVSIGQSSLVNAGTPFIVVQSLTPVLFTAWTCHQ